MIKPDIIFRSQKEIPIKFFADLHLHSKFSIATSKHADIEGIYRAACIKGISLVATGDISHPAWRAECRRQLTEDHNGFFLPAGRVSPDLFPALRREVRFVLSGEISSIYKKNGRVRKIHNLVYFPSFDTADRFCAELERRNCNIRSDGRPITGLDAKTLLDIYLNICPDGLFIPAHIWTPHFSLLGLKSGFDTIEECFGDLSPNIFACETGLSSDPAMNRMLSMLDRVRLVSNSDAHSPEKLGREANIFSCACTFSSLAGSLRTGDGFEGTVEFFPEEGKYHYAGHRKCGIFMSPEQTEKAKHICPVCREELTPGVLGRVYELADRKYGEKPDSAKPFISTVPLAEIIAAACRCGPAARKVHTIYETIILRHGPELAVLTEVPPEELSKSAGDEIAEAVKRVRAGEISLRPGYDGEYGKINLFPEQKKQQMSTGRKIAKAYNTSAKQEKNLSRARKKNTEKFLSTDQQTAAGSASRVTLVLAGPGSGKTRTLTGHIIYLLEKNLAGPEEICAVTFTNRAARELADRIRPVSCAVKISTLHSFCYDFVRSCRDFILLEPDVSESLFRSLQKKHGINIQAVKKIDLYRALCIPQEKWDPEILIFYRIWQNFLKDHGFIDLQGIFEEALLLAVSTPLPWKHICVDEFQDIDPLQASLIRAFYNKGASLFLIGDPDQSIYGFRGAAPGIFTDFSMLPEAKKYLLTENFRNPRNVLTAAQKIIHFSSCASVLVTRRRPARSLFILSSPSDRQQAIFIAHDIARKTGGLDMLSVRGREKTPCAFSEIAVLTRVYAHIPLIEEALKKEGIPCITSGAARILKNEKIQKALMLCRLARHTLPRGYDFFLNELSKTEQAAISEQLREIKFPAVLKKACELLRIPEQQQKIFLTYAGTFPDLDSLLAAGAAGIEIPDSSEAVRIITMHAAKGLEFRHVFIAGAVQGVIPFTRTGFDPDEERRLFYVALTRAQETCTIICPQSAKNIKTETSEFIKAIEDFSVIGSTRDGKKENIQMKFF